VQIGRLRVWDQALEESRKVRRSDLLTGKRAYEWVVITLEETLFRRVVSGQSFFVEIL
jgi:hypothetical protein